MFRLEETEIAKAVERCRELHPTVRVIHFGEYIVTGAQEGIRYTTKCGAFMRSEIIFATEPPQC